VGGRTAKGRPRVGQMSILDLLLLSNEAFLLALRVETRDTTSEQHPS
jgi:hypothetical protein